MIIYLVCIFKFVFQKNCKGLVIKWGVFVSGWEAAVILPENTIQFSAKGFRKYESLFSIYCSYPKRQTLLVFACFV